MSTVQELQASSLGFVNSWLKGNKFVRDIRFDRENEDYVATVHEYRKYAEMPKLLPGDKGGYMVPEKTTKYYFRLDRVEENE